MSEQGTTEQSGAAGRTVGHGRYLLRELLGQGGMATVHLADDTVLDRPVAVKSMLGNMSAEPSFRERFRREAQAVARLNHPNIVSVFDSGEDVNEDGVHAPFIVMEYIEGGSLSSVLRDDIAAHGAMPTDKALKITGDVLAALGASHEQGLVHRDIKPANVMLTRRNTVKVMDFGIARAMQSGVTSMTQTGMVVGTPQYLSPEQALGKAVDARSDLYSVGCLLFELLTGRLPFESDTALGMAYQHVQDTPPAPSSFNAAVTPAVDALVARALRKDPGHRFQTADEMREECERLAGAGGANTPLIIGEGPRVTNIGGSGANAVFPPAQGQLGTMPPQQPYQQQPMPHPSMPGTPPPQSYVPGPTPPPTPYPQGGRPGMPTPPPTPTPYPQAMQGMHGGMQQGVQTPPPYRPTPAPTPLPRPTPMPQPPRPGTPVPRPVSRPVNTGQQPHTPIPKGGRGCGAAAAVVGVIVGVLVLLVLILVLVLQNNGSSSNTTDNGSGRLGPVAAEQASGGPALLG
ncbi:protein kinase domain-containing protein [Streptacidiphilus carbonis]|jgi:eukaryotic-like serine/threonine-protein kinase|uniref:protein kinase domain-containing protein n=1 Tax=Streptacidiphilus carbonis TaxID=105422 RepID=UPI0007C7E09E|nr:protein kinase [Streptacidiphilus carbonis]